MNKLLKSARLAHRWRDLTRLFGTTIARRSCATSFSHACGEVHVARVMAHTQNGTGIRPGDVCVSSGRASQLAVLDEAPPMHYVHLAISRHHPPFLPASLPSYGQACPPARIHPLSFREPSYILTEYNLVSPSLRTANAWACIDTSIRERRKRDFHPSGRISRLLLADACESLAPRHGHASTNGRMRTMERDVSRAHIRTTKLRCASAKVGRYSPRALFGR